MTNGTSTTTDENGLYPLSYFTSLFFLVAVVACALLIFDDASYSLAVVSGETLITVVPTYTELKPLAFTVNVTNSGIISLWL